MKNFFLSLAVLTLPFYTWAGSEQYKLNDNEIEQLFANAEDISVLLAGDMTLQQIAHSSASQSSSLAQQTVGGFLIRCFFCGGIALHRYYMGSDWGQLWWKYFCIPVAGGVAALGDFCFVLFGGKNALNKYKGNNDWFVWI